MKMGGGGLGGLEVGDGVDFAAAGVKDLNNFKGYHNQEEHKNGGFSNDDKLAKQEGDPADFELIHGEKTQIHWTG